MLCDLLGFAELVDHEVRLSSFDDGLDLRTLVSWYDDEAVVLGVDAVVLGDRQADHAAAALLAALAEDLEHPVSADFLVGLLELAVGRTEHRFVLRDPLVARVHASESTPPCVSTSPRAYSPGGR